MVEGLGSDIPALSGNPDPAQGCASVECFILRSNLGIARKLLQADTVHEGVTPDINMIHPDIHAFQASAVHEDTGIDIIHAPEPGHRPERCASRESPSPDGFQIHKLIQIPQACTVFESGFTNFLQMGCQVQIFQAFAVDKGFIADRFQLASDHCHQRHLIRRHNADSQPDLDLRLPRQPRRHDEG